MNFDKLNFVDLFDPVTSKDNSLSLGAIAESVTIVADEGELCNRDAILLLILKELRIINAVHRKD
jgi:hypothetical protein